MQWNYISSNEKLIARCLALTWDPSSPLITFLWLDSNQQFVVFVNQPDPRNAVSITDTLWSTSPRSHQINWNYKIDRPDPTSFKQDCLYNLKIIMFLVLSYLSTVNHVKIILCMIFLTPEKNLQTAYYFITSNTLLQLENFSQYYILENKIRINLDPTHQKPDPNQPVRRKADLTSLSIIQVAVLCRLHCVDQYLVSVFLLLLWFIDIIVLGALLRLG